MNELRKTINHPATELSANTNASVSNNYDTKNTEPRKALGLADAIAVIVGIVIGAGIFRTPSLVASSTGSAGMFLTVWVLGGVVSLIGALCYAELTTTFPNTGGDYHFLRRAYGNKLAFVFAWARMSVVQTGSIALLAFIIGDYMSEIYSIGRYSSVAYAALTVIVLTGINIMGVQFGAWTQKLLTIIEVAGILIIIITGFFLAPGNNAGTENAATSASQGTSAGMAMVFVLLTFGGWNEAAYLSSELRSGPKQIAKAFIYGILIITVVYVLANLAYLKALGIEGMASSNAVAGDLMRLVFGETGILLIGIMVTVSALTSVNATIFTGARTNFALGRDFRVFSGLGKWNSSVSAPVNAFIVQGLISLALISLGLFTRNGFETMIEYTAPVFWLFFLLTGIALFVLRRKEPHVQRPFRVPLYPVTPAIFCLTSGYLLYSSLAYTGLGAMVGVGVLLSGVLLLLILPLIRKRSADR